VRRAIETYTGPGDLVIDPMCGLGITLTEAIELGRRAIGVELEPGTASLAAANAVRSRSHGAPGQALVMPGDGRLLGRGLCDDLVGQATLVLASPTSRSLAIAHEILEVCMRMLRPDGHIVLVVRDQPGLPAVVELTSRLRAAA
jgi:SAM-dependent methyltransferase